MTSAAPTVIVVQHDADAPAGLVGEVLRERGLALHPWAPGDPLDPGTASGVLVLGGAAHADDAEHAALFAQERALLRAAGDAGLPVLGICLGAQLLAQAYGGEVHRLAQPEIGWTDVVVAGTATGDGLLDGAAGRHAVFQWHYFGIRPPRGSAVLATNPTCVQAFRTAGNAWGLQFHVEATAAIVRDWIGDGHELAAAGRDPDRWPMLVDDHFTAQARLAEVVATNFAGAVRASRADRRSG